jgi:hypothetical protein
MPLAHEREKQHDAQGATIARRQDAVMARRKDRRLLDPRRRRPECRRSSVARKRRRRHAPPPDATQAAARIGCPPAEIGHGWARAADARLGSEPPPCRHACIAQHRRLPTTSPSSSRWRRRQPSAPRRTVTAHRPCPPPKWQDGRRHRRRSRSMRERPGRRGNKLVLIGGPKRPI